MSLDFNPDKKETYDVIIIGGGPAGSTAAIYTARAGWKTLVIDKGLTAGALGRSSQIANFPGVPEPLSGAELVTRMREQAESFGATFVDDKVLRADIKKDPKQIWVGQGAHEGRAVIIATGAMGRTNRVPGENRLLGRGVSYCATCDAAFFRDKAVAVVGNNDEALEEALTLTRFASEVHLVSPTPELTASRDVVDELKSHPQVTTYVATKLREILGEDSVESITVYSREEGERTIPVSGVFIYLQGNVPIVDFLGEQAETDEGGCLLVDEFHQTTTPGVFAAGDVLCKHVKQAVIAAAEGAKTAVAVDRHLQGREKLRPDWSH
ncbi:MAG TPA: FAD-dependent oxidoreductase [Chloroflexi bacterium]|nr:FAD-dependent oxidoreductase [Chloroflexota bacterium]